MERKEMIYTGRRFDLRRTRMGVCVSCFCGRIEPEEGLRRQTIVNKLMNGSFASTSIRVIEIVLPTFCCRFKHVSYDRRCLSFNKCFTIKRWTLYKSRKCVWFLRQMLREYYISASQWKCTKLMLTTRIRWVTKDVLTRSRQCSVLFLFWLKYSHSTVEFQAHDILEDFPGTSKPYLERDKLDRISNTFEWNACIPVWEST